MARLARVVVPGLPHHVTQRGNRRQRTFFETADYLRYRAIAAEQCRTHGLAVWAYCLMPNHVHLIVVPARTTALAAAIGETHRRYTRYINAREDWQGYLWQGRFASVVMDEAHLLAASRYVELNPVRAGLTASAAAWPWSSARSHLSGVGDGLCDPAPLLARLSDWQALLRQPGDTGTLDALRRHTRTGRPLGDERFVARLEMQLGRQLRRRRPGPRRHSSGDT